MHGQRGHRQTSTSACCYVFGPCRVETVSRLYPITARTKIADTAAPTAAKPPRSHQVTPGPRAVNAPISMTGPERSSANIRQFVHSDHDCRWLPSMSTGKIQVASRMDRKDLESCCLAPGMERVSQTAVAGRRGAGQTSVATAQGSVAPDNPSPPSRHVTPRLASPIPFVGRAANRRARAGVLLD